MHSEGGEGEEYDADVVVRTVLNHSARSCGGGSFQHVRTLTVSGHIAPAAVMIRLVMELACRCVVPKLYHTFPNSCSPELYAAAVGS